MSLPSQQGKQTSPRQFGYAIIFTLVTLAIFASLIVPDLLRNQRMDYQEGDVSDAEILAPYPLSYESKVITEQARADARSKVAQAYLPPDPEIAKAQLETLGKALYFINSVRKDSLATPSQKDADLKTLLKPELNESMRNAVINLSDENWDAISKEAERVLEIVLRGSIREGSVQQAQSNLKALISYTLPTNQDEIVVNLVSPLIIPTSVYSEELTNQAREEAANTIQAQIRHVAAGEVLVRRGSILKPLDIEALENFGLLHKTNLETQIVRAGVLTLLVSLILYLFYYANRDRIFAKLRPLALTAISFIVYLAFARFTVSDRTVIPYLFPLAAFGMTLSVLFNGQMSIFHVTILSILVVFGKDSALEMLFYYVLPSFTGILLISRGRKISSFALAGLGVIFSSFAVILAFRFGDPNTDAAEYTALIAGSLINGFASGALTLLFQYLFSELLDQPTALQLMDLSRPDHPLLQHILRLAPGTYQHSLLVSNLAEQAAEAVHADRLLIRVGTLYHDAGKTLNPDFYIENQGRGKIDSHDSLPPEEAAQMVINHVTEGLNLARKYHLPGRILDFIREHHGTMLTRYQYSQAVEKAGSDPSKVDKSKFRYPGPAPRSKETAILMLADGTEARARANSPKTEEEIRELIDNAISFIRGQGQLDNTDLTLHDLKLIADSFYETLLRSYHPRIKYPEPQMAPSDSKQEVTQEIRVNQSSK